MSSLSFWNFQLSNAWRNLADHSLPGRIAELGRFTASCVSQHHAASGAPMVGTAIPDHDKLTIIVMNHKRPANVGQIARYALRCGFVGRVIISNNSQAYPIARYVSLEDPRLTLIDQPEPSGVGISMELAREFPARYYVRIDDDIFLNPSQLQWIYWNLVTRDDRTHGIFGALYLPDRNPADEWPFKHQRNKTGSIDILNGLFAFTDRHLEEYYRLCKILDLPDQRKIMNGEDIVLSFAGNKRPLIHNIGLVWECASESSPNVALHQSRPKFYEERWSLFSRLLELKKLAE